MELQVGEELAPNLDAWHSLIHLLPQAKEIDMDWDAIGAIGEVLGAVSVLITLLYLSRQISASNKALNTAGTTAMMEGFNEFHTWAISTEDLAKTNFYFYNEPEADLSDYEINNLKVMTRVYANQVYKLYLLHQLGAMPDDQWKKALTVASHNFNLTEFGRNFKNENAVFEEMWAAMDELENAAA